MSDDAHGFGFYATIGSVLIAGIIALWRLALVAIDRERAHLIERNKVLEKAYAEEKANARAAEARHAQELRAMHEQQKRECDAMRAAHSKEIGELSASMESLKKIVTAILAERDNRKK